jgi:uncharacterized lipoprotein YbaY
VIGESSFLTDERDPPLPFEVRVDLMRVDQARSYGLRVVVRSEGRILYATPKPVPVITQGNPMMVAVLLAPAS